MSPIAVASDEQLLRRETFHPAIFVFPILFLIGFLACITPPIFFMSLVGSVFGGAFGPIRLLFLVLAGLMGLVGFSVTLAAYLNSEMVLTTRRVMYRTGVLFRAAGELPLENIEGIVLFEPFLGRLFGYGTLTVTTLGGAVCPLVLIPKPQILHALLQKAVISAKAARQALQWPADRAAAKTSPWAECEEVAWSAGSTHRAVPPLAIWSGVAMMAIIATLAAVLRPAGPSAPPFAGPVVVPSLPVSLPTPIIPAPLAAPFQQPMQRSIEEIKAAAEHGEPEAEEKLGDLYRSDPKKAVFWYRKAASQGLANSEYQLANLLLSPASSPAASNEARAVNTDEAIHWLIKAANQGFKLAQVDLASLYRDGQFLAKDLPEAYKWF